MSHKSLGSFSRKSEWVRWRKRKNLKHAPGINVLKLTILMMNSEWTDKEINKDRIELFKKFTKRHTNTHTPRKQFGTVTQKKHWFKSINRWINHLIWTKNNKQNEKMFISENTGKGKKLGKFRSTTTMMMMITTMASCNNLAPN